MRKKHFTLKIAALLLAYVAFVPANISHWFFGEPQLPKSLDK